MAKNNLLLGMFIMVVAVFGLRVMVAQMTKTTVTKLTPGNPPLAKAGSTYTVGQLFDLINNNNPYKNSNFIVPMKAGKPIPASGDIRQISGSYSAKAAGLANIIETNKAIGTKVTLQADDTLINFLYAQKRLNSQTKANYAQILLYFELGGYRFYLADPFPGIIKLYAIQSSGVNIASNIIKKWDYNKIYVPAN